MVVKYRFGHNTVILKKENPGFVRPKTFRTFDQMDMKLVKDEVKKLGAKTILEFGPGNSTERFAEMGLKVTSIEHIERWYLENRERFKNHSDVRILRGYDEIPFRVDGLGDDERFDLAFVDAPAGYAGARKIHKGYEDCNRFNTCLLALQRCPVVFLHDANRPVERGTLNKLHLMGYKYEHTESSLGTVKIYGKDETGTDSPRPT